MPSNLNTFDDDATRKIKRVVQRTLASLEPRGKRGRYPRRGSGGGGSEPSNGGSTWFGIVTEEIQAATSRALDDAGTGMVQEVDDAGDDVGDPVEVKNRYYDIVAVDTPVYIEEGTNIFKHAGCATEP